MSAETDAALMVLRGAMDQSDDPLVVFGYMASAGALALDSIGIEVNGPPEMKIDIGTDQDPDCATIAVTWKLAGISAGASHNRPTED